MASAAVGVPLLLYLVYRGGWPLAAATGLLSVLVVLEVSALLEQDGLGLGVCRPWAIGWAALANALVGVSLGGLLPEAMTLWILIFFGRQVALAAAGRDVTATAREALGTVFAFVYMTAFLVYLPLLRQMPGGLAFALLVLVVTWANDTLAYFAGRFLGRRKLCPALSPGKTVVGAVAGLLAAGAAGFLMGNVPAGPGGTAGLAVGVLVGVAGQVGDLFASLLKRAAGAKDAGRLIPGHGGVLDRFDSLAFALPAAFYLVVFLGAGYDKV